MSVAHIDTFEHDVAEEVKTKEASVVTIASASNDVGNPTDPSPIVPAFSKPEVPSSGGFWSEHRQQITIIVGIVFCILLISLAAWYYVTQIQSNTAAPTQNPALGTTTPSITQNTALTISSLSPVLQGAIGDFVSSIQKTDTGYILTLESFSPVYVYMLKNEKAYVDELSFSLQQPQNMTTEEVLIAPPQPDVLTANANTPLASTTRTSTTTGTTTASSSVVRLATTTILTASTTGTTTPVISLVPAPTISNFIPEPIPFTFTDTTISNQNMRIATSGTSTIVYAFINTRALVIATSTGNILLLRNEVIR